MTCKDCDECTAWNPFPWIEGGKLCLFPHTSKGEFLDYLTDLECVSSEDIRRRVKEAQCPTTTSED